MKTTFKELTELYLQNADITKGSKETYRRCINIFQKWIVYSGRKVNELQRADILAFKSELSKNGKSEATIELYLRVVNNLYEYAENNSIYDNIAAGIRIKNKNRIYKKGHLNKDEATLLLSSIDRTTTIGKRDYAIVNLMLRCGLRCVEVSRLRVCDIDITDKGSYISIQRKGRLSRSEKLGLTEKMIEPVKDYMSHIEINSDKDPIFRTSVRENNPLTSLRIGCIVKKRLQACGLYSPSIITAHSLRHTAAVLAILQKVPIKEVQTMLGHRGIETTEIYLKSIEDEIRLNNPAGKALDDIF